MAIECHNTFENVLRVVFHSSNLLTKHSGIFFSQSYMNTTVDNMPLITGNNNKTTFIAICTCTSLKITYDAHTHSSRILSVTRQLNKIVTKLNNLFSRQQNH